jgi:hypothetical protein
MLTVDDVFDAVRDVLSREALLAAGDIKVPRKKKRRKAKATVTAAPETPQVPAAAPGEPTAPAPQAG